ncbi:hypothetical protein [Streptomyces sp. NPDC093707]|uniref:hypothetical protein n=1 Tax=Streptomyces sp. NPDC093707 TaxID=3154984 RepID=UPI00344B6398
MTTTHLMPLPPSHLHSLPTDSTMRCEPPPVPIPPAHRRSTLRTAGHLPLRTQQTALPPARTGYDEVTEPPAPPPGTRPLSGRLTPDIPLPERTPQRTPSRSRDVA